jgi:hypothetical protein
VHEAAMRTAGLEVKPGAHQAAGAAVGAAQEQAALGDLGAGDVQGSGTVLDGIDRIDRLRSEAAEIRRSTAGGNRAGWVGFPWVAP